MTIAAVGTGFASTSKTFSLTPGGVGDFILFDAISETSADPVTALASSNVTWTVLVAPTVIGSLACTKFIGKVTAASAATVTATSAGSPTLRMAGQEYSTTVGYASITLDKSTTGNGTAAFPSLTPTAAGEMYHSYCFAASGTTAGSTSGYSYYVDPNQNPMAWDTSCGAGAQAPNIGTPDTLTGIAVLLYEAGGTAHTATASLALTASTSVGQHAAHPRTAALALTAGTTVAQAAAHRRPASLALTVAAAVTRTASYHVTAQLALTASATATASGGNQPAAAPSSLLPFKPVLP